MSSVNRYRIFCKTEQTNVYVWNTLKPTVCPNNNTHLINIDSIVIVDDINTTQSEITNLNSDNTQTLQVIQKNVIISLSPCMGISLLRNNVITTGSGTITNNPMIDSEIKLNCSGANDSCILRSIDRGISGLTCEVGIAMRMPNNLTVNQEIKWGYFSNENGFYFKLTNKDFQVCIMNNSQELCISKSAFNVDTLDGTGKSGNSIDFSKGNIFKISFSSYGFGIVSFGMIGKSKNNQQSNLIMHEYQTIGHTSTRMPNLPIQVIFNNNGTVANTDVFVAGRSFSILGKYVDNVREVFMYKYLAAISNEVYLPLFSIKRKYIYTGCTVKISRIYIKSSVDCELQIISGATLTSTVWVENTHHSESVVEIDKTSNTVSGGAVLYTMLIFANETREHSFEDTIMHLNEMKPITIIAKSLTGQSGNITVNVGYKEYW
jgi:hypothetical protein